MALSEHQKIRKLFEDPVSFSLEFPSVFAQFYQWGFFVDTYTDEAALFRYLYNRDVVFKSDYHLVLMNMPDQQFSSAFIEPIIKHIKQTIDSKEAKFICIEWRGRNILNSFESFIRPLLFEANKLYKKAEMELLGQIEVNFSNSSLIHNKLYHNKGVPTYMQTLQAVRNIITLYPGYRLRLRVIENPCEKNERERFMKQIDDAASKRIHWVWESEEKGKNEATQTNSAAFYRILMNKNSEEINPDQTVALLAPRKNAVVICPDGNVYMSVPNNFTQETEPEGTLNKTDGSILWDEAKREKRLSRLWFEFPNCAACPHLPLFVGVCPLLSINIGQICPIDNKLIDPETIIVKEFESKNR